MWIYLLICIFFIYALIKEREALGCTGRGVIAGCKNEDGKAIVGTTPYPNDSVDTIYNKIQLAASYQERFVKWRMVYIISTMAAFLLWFVLFRRIPTEWELVVIITILIFVGMGACNFYKFHLSDYIQENIDKSVEILKAR